MIKKSIQASAFVKKSYAKPQMQTYQVQPSSIICTSDTAKTENLQEETYNW